MGALKFKHIANIVLSAVLLIAGGNIVIKVVDYKKSENLYSQMQTLANQNKGESSYIQQLNTYEQMKKLNDEYKFWITVENTNIDYPVVQAEDNSFYLTNDFNKKHSKSGTIFMDTLNNFSLDKNVVLYGHNMNNKTMFNNINKFKKQEFFEANNKVIIKNTNDGKEYIYEPFAVYSSDNNFDYNTVLFSENYTFEQYVKDIKKKSLFKKSVDISEKDKIITLSTCSYEFKGAKTTVHAKLIEVKDLNPEKVNNIETEREEQENPISINDMIEY